MRAYIKREEVPTIDLAAAHYGLKELGYDIFFYNENEVDEIPKSASVIVGYIQELQTFFEINGFGKQLAINIPSELNTPDYLGRTLSYMTIGEFRKQPFKPTFIKPARYPKEFMAGVITLPSSIEFLKDTPDDTPALLSNIVDIVSEYRCYIINKKLVGIKHYQGDCRIFPNVQVIDNMINDYKSAPRGYSIDVGILDSGKTILIEVQDGWALGNYGLEADVYARLLTTRWFELTKKA